MPSISADCFRMLVLELHANEKFCWIVRLRISGDEEAFIGLDADQQSREQSERILPEDMRVIFGIVCLVSIFDLEAAFIVGPIAGRRARREEGISDNAHALAIRCLEGDNKWSSVGRRSK